MSLCEIENLCSDSVNCSNPLAMGAYTNTINSTSRSLNSVVFSL